MALTKVAALAALALAATLTVVAATATDAAAGAAATTAGEASAAAMPTAARTLGGYCKWFKKCHKFYERSYFPCHHRWADGVAVADRHATDAADDNGALPVASRGGGYGGGNDGKYTYKKPEHDEDPGFEGYGKHHRHGKWWGGHHGGEGEWDGVKYFCKERDGFSVCRLRWHHGYKKTYYCRVRKCFYTKKCFF